MTGSGTGGGAGGGDPYGEDHAARLQGINGRLATRIAELAPGECSAAASAALMAIAVQSNRDGRCWYQFSRLELVTKLSQRTLKDALRHVAKTVPGLVFYVEREKTACLPWPRSACPIPPDAWGFWIPIAACATTAAVARARCAASIREHLAYAGARWPVEGAGLSELLNPGAASSAAPASDLLTEALPAAPASVSR